VQRSPADGDASLCVITKPHGRGGHSPRWAAEPEKIIINNNNNNGWPGSSVGIATGYGLDGPGIESRWGRDFSHTSRPVLRPTKPPVQWVPALSRR
jgi:hypothetical protein